MISLRLRGKDIFAFLPFLVSGSTIFQTLLQINFNNLHWIILWISIFILILRGKKFKPNIAVFLLCMSFISLCISAYMLPSIFIPCIGLVELFSPGFFWALYLNRYQAKFDEIRFVEFIVVSGTIMAVFAIYQRFYDVTLFGIMSTFKPTYLFEGVLNRVEVFRATSFFSSTQVYSMFEGATSVILLENWNRLSKVVSNPVVIFIQLIGGMLSGGKMYGLFIFMYFFVKMIRAVYKMLLLKKIMLSKYIGFSLGLFLFFVCLFCLFDYNTTIINIISAIQNAGWRVLLLFVDREKFLVEESVRMNFMSQLFNADMFNILWGHGLGKCSYAAYNVLGGVFNFERITIESYALSWWYEMGIIGMAMFILLFGVQSIVDIICGNRYGITKASIVVAMFFSPAFFSVSFLAFWYFFIKTFYEPVRRNNCNIT